MQETYLRHLERLKVMSPEEVSQQKERLIASTPGKEWPYGFPASLDPRLVIIGVSPGNSPYKPKAGEESKRFLSEPGVINGEESHYYYPDTRRYWNKIRFLASSYFNFGGEYFSELDALSLTTHINLGENSSGKATLEDVEDDFVAWASSLVNKIHNPDVVILLGLKKIIKSVDVSKRWNHSGGLKINWNNSGNKITFPCGAKNYTFELWKVVNSHEKEVKVVLWPNHPSRSPFGSMENWESSVKVFLAQMQGT